jgi:hypothetical protein
MMLQLNLRQLSVSFRVVTDQLQNGNLNLLIMFTQLAIALIITHFVIEKLRMMNQRIKELESMLVIVAVFFSSPVEFDSICKQ